MPTVPLPTGQSLTLDHHGTSSDGPALVLLHGLSGNRRTWDRVVDHLVTGPGGRHGSRTGGPGPILQVDLRGHGQSTRADLDRYDAVSYADDIAALIETLDRTARPAVVVGHSLGGVVAATLAVRRPDLVRAVLLEDPPLFEGDDERRAASPVARFFPRLVAAVRDLQARGAAPDEYRTLAETMSAPDEIDERCQALHQWDPSTMEAALAGVVWRGYDPDLPLGCPATVVRADPAAGAVFEPGDAERFARANPGAEIVVVPGATHSVHATATLDPFLAHLDRFLATL